MSRVKDRIKDYELDVDYASAYFDVVPRGYIDKTVCGCGLTTVAIESNESIVLAMPNVELIRNKVKQDSSYALLGVYGGVGEKEINSYRRDCKERNKPLKVLVTYDSLWKCEYLLSECRLIIDESDRLLANAKLKLKGRKGIEDISCIDYLLNVAKAHKEDVSFISATPVPLEYLPEWMSTDIDQVFIRWNNTLRIVPMCMKRARPLVCLKNEILNPLNKFGTIEINNVAFSSVIVFINSISSIKKAIKDTGIDLDDVGIICADNLRNDIKISGIKRISDYAHLPKYTFVTSSGFQGMDLYSKDAMTVVVSSTGNDFQMIDMKTDLKQAVSRQRIKSNPTYGKYIYIYNQSMFDVSKDELIKNINTTHHKLMGVCDRMNNDKAIEDFFSEVVEESKTFVEYVNKVDGKYSVNELSFNADKYFILETREQYKKGFMVQNVLGDDVRDVNPTMIDNVSYEDMVAYFLANHVNGLIDWQANYNPAYSKIIEECYKKVGKVYKNYTKAYDTAYNIDLIDFSVIKSYVRENVLPEGDYARKDIKKRLQLCYDDYEINRKAEWKDVYEIFDKVQLIMVKGKRLVRIY